MFVLVMVTRCVPCYALIVVMVQIVIVIIVVGFGSLVVAHAALLLIARAFWTIPPTQVWRKPLTTFTPTAILSPKLRYGAGLTKQSKPFNLTLLTKQGPAGKQ